MDDPVDHQRRDLIGAAATVAVMAALPTTGNAVSKEAQLSDIPAFRSAGVLKPLPFDAAKLSGISERLIRSHWENNYGGTVKALVTIKQHFADSLANQDTPPFVYNELKREHLLRTGSVVLHELYFENLGGDGEADATTRQRLADEFGSFDTWETEFRRIGIGLGGGSGWVMLGYNLHTGRLENYWMADHAHGAAASVPLLVMDMYEHAYQMDYGAAAPKYIDAFFRNIQWDLVASRFSRWPRR
ncbi:MAG: superoxide dismutase [Gammaproteobacteria bacterium]|nr:superoxide dismutase [Gammaproteobacteria bacterium]